MSRHWIFLFVILLVSNTVEARTIKVCISDKSVPPLFYDNSEGAVQKRIRHALERMGDTVKFVVKPRGRCLKDVYDGRYEATFGAQTPTIMKMFALPSKNSRLDLSRSIAQIPATLLIRKNSAITWDGKQLRGITTPVLYRNGFKVVEDKLRLLHILGYDAAQTIQQLKTMLLANRSDAAIVIDVMAYKILESKQYRDEFKTLSPPFLQANVFLVFNKHFYNRNTSYVNILWDNISLQHAEPIRICVSESIPPMFYHRPESNIPANIRQVVERQGYRLEFVVEPRHRCLESVKSGKYQALFGADIPFLVKNFAFPLKESIVNSRRRIARSTLLLVKRGDSPITWDGKTIKGLSRPVLYRKGILAAEEKLKALHIPTFDSPSTGKQIIKNLIAGRADAAVLIDSTVNQLEKLPQYHNKIVTFSMPFVTVDMYLLFGKKFANHNSDFVNTVWRMISINQDKQE